MFSTYTSIKNTWAKAEVLVQVKKYRFKNVLKVSKKQLFVSTSDFVQSYLVDGKQNFSLNFHSNIGIQLELGKQNMSKEKEGLKKKLCFLLPTL